LPEQRSILGVTQWVLVGGLASVAVDLDVIALVLARSGREERLKQFRNPAQIQRKFTLFMDTLAETGILKTAMKTHFIISAVIILLSYCFLRQYFLPVTLGVVSHLLSDTPNLRKLNTPR